MREAEELGTEPERLEWVGPSASAAEVPSVLARMARSEALAFVMQQAFESIADAADVGSGDFVIGNLSAGRYPGGFTALES